jgi:hypothetical protein
LLSGGDLSQVKDADIVSDNGNAELRAAGDVNFDHVKAANRVNIASGNGAISQDGDTAADIVAKEAILQANNGIGSNNALETTLQSVDARNNGLNDIALNNHGSLRVDDLDGDGYALYNKGGNIRITTDGALTQATPTAVFAANNLDIKAQKNIYLSNMIAGHNMKLRSIAGDILGDSGRNPNISVGNQLGLYADKGVIGTPTHPISLIRKNGPFTVEAGEAKNFLSTYIFGANAPSNNFLDGGLSAYDNRVVSGDLIEQYYGMHYSYNEENPVVTLNIAPNTFKNNMKASDLIEDKEQ